MTKVIIIDYHMGNVASATKALEKLGAEVRMSNKKEDLDWADHIVLPGVGAFGDGMKNLRELGLVELLNRRVLDDRVPFIGLCLGMQLLGEVGHEFGRHEGLGWIKGEVIRLEPGPDLRLPHIGWNEVKKVKNDLLFNGITDFNFYFVHSYFLKAQDREVVVGTCEYGQEFPAALHQGNIFATQFHPEKSQANGLKLLENFLKYSNA